MEQPSWIGRTLNNRYKIEALLGQGGMSAVYKATDPNLRRMVAIKMIHPHLATDSQFIARFEEEAAAVAKLRHPNIVQVFDFNADGDVVYMVLEFIPGETLQQRMTRLNSSGRQLSIGESINFTLNICDAAGYAHKQGIIHRDIKPANIMLDVYGQAILMDFGIVKIIGGDSHTATGAVLGTARYMAPEMIRSEVPDQRSDIYSMGITLYEMLSGEPPFNSDSAMSLMMMHLNDPVPDLRTVRPEVPQALAGIVEKALEKDPERRFGSTGEMAAELKQMLAEIEVQQGEVTAITPEPPEVDSRQMETQAAVPPNDEDAGKTEAAPGKEQEAAGPPAGAEDEISREDLPAPEPEPTMVEASPVPPAPALVEDGAEVGSSEAGKVRTKRPFPVVGAGIAGVLVVIAVIVGVILFGGGDGETLSAETDGVDTLPVAVVEDTQTPTPLPPQPTDTATATPTATSTPTATPTMTLTPTQTLPPLYARINDITVNESNQYVVDYETFGYTETLPGMHVHFFFDTVPPEEAGLPGGGPWKLYGGPRPFTGYALSDTPAEASQMCALVAYENHSVILESGNCFDLP